MEKELKLKGGLCELSEDLRDFPLGAVFGIAKDLPQEFLVSGTDKLKVKNQGGSDLCSAYATCYASELQELVELNPEFNFAFSKKLSGDIDAWGQNLRHASKALVEFGSVEQLDYLKGWKGKGTTRDWKNWGADLIYLAEEHKKKSYFRADLGIGNKFDLIKSALYKNNSAVISGLEWKPEYTYIKNGIIKPSQSSGFGHAVVLLGWKIIDSEEYLIIHNSIGDLGDNGRWYLPKNMVDELRFGNYQFVDLPREEVEFMLKNNIQITDNWIVKLYKIIKKWLCEK